VSLEKCVIFRVKLKTHSYGGSFLLKIRRRELLYVDVYNYWISDHDTPRVLNPVFSDPSRARFPAIFDSQLTPLSSVLLGTLDFIS